MPAHAQEQSVQDQVGAAHALLNELDTLAGTCLNPADTSLADTCGQFLAALDGELVATYLQQCERLRVWREEFVTAQFTTDTDTTTNATQLQNLVGVDYVCGEQTLLRRTQFVADAFALTRQSGANPEGSAVTLNRRLSELQFESRLEAERRSLLESVEMQRQRREQETARQMQQLENELIRQQIAPLNN